jgi:hypothetical protein
MVDLDQQFLQSQQQLLMEIRDELRATRGMQAGGSTGGMAIGAARPGHTFVAAQAMADRALLGQWNSFGWNQAYSATYHSTLFGDLSALIGFNRAPQTLTQEEFRGLAGQNIAARASNFAMGMIAPGYVAQTNALADDIYRNSSRFIRAGNPNAGVMGTGFDFGVARQISRAIQHEALGDLRMSGTDYSTITSLGMQSGQFDRVQDMSEFKARVRELASATADMTRAIHMTVSEVGTAMGNLRQMGVMNVAQQKSILMQVGGSAMVAGMSAPEMLQFAGSIGQQGQAMGLGAAGTMPAAAQTLAAIRSLSQAGIISQGTLAAGGGAAAVGSQISMAEMRFATSQAGFLSQVGGGGRAGANSISAMLGGMGAAGVGTFEGAVTFGMDKFAAQQHTSAAEISRLMENQFTTSLHMMGITDTTSRTAQGLVFNMAKQAGMDDAAAMTYVQMHNTAGGRRATDQAVAQNMMMVQQRERAAVLDRIETFTSAKGRIQGALQNVESLGASIADSGMSFIEEMTGNSVASRHARDVRAIGGGTRGVGFMSPADFADAVFSRSNGPENQITTTHIRNHDASSFGAVAAGIGVGVLAGTATLATSGLAAPLLIGLGAFMGSSALTTALAMDTQTTLTGNRAKLVNDFQGLLLGVDPDSAKNDRILANGGLKKNDNYYALMAMDAAGPSSAKDMEVRRFHVAKIAEHNGMTSQEVLNYMASLGKTFSPADMASITSSGISGASDVQTKALSSVLFGVKSAGTLDSSASSAAMADFIESVSTGKEVGDKTLKALRIAKFTDDDQTTIRKNISHMMAGGLGSTSAITQSVSGLRADVTLFRYKNAENMWKGLTNLVDARAGELGEDDKKLFESDKQSKSDTIDRLLGSGATHDLAVGGKLGSTANEIALLSGADITRNAGQSTEDYTRDLVKKYNIDSSLAANLYEFANSKPADKDMKKFLAATIANSAGERQDQANTAVMSEAQMLQSASEILKKLKEDLGIKK